MFAPVSHSALAIPTNLLPTHMRTYAVGNMLTVDVESVGEGSQFWLSSSFALFAAPVDLLFLVLRVATCVLAGVESFGLFNGFSLHR